MMLGKVHALAPHHSGVGSYSHVGLGLRVENDFQGHELMTIAPPESSGTRLGEARAFDSGRGPEGTTPSFGAERFAPVGAPIYYSMSPPAQAS